jgi:hypothetical protein
VTIATAAYRSDMDVFGVFFRERYIVQPSAVARAKDLYDT